MRAVAGRDCAVPVAQVLDVLDKLGYPFSARRGVATVWGAPKVTAGTEDGLDRARFAGPSFSLSHGSACGTR
jgi:hypothetical protein